MTILEARNNLADAIERDRDDPDSSYWGNIDQAMNDLMATAQQAIETEQESVSSESVAQLNALTTATKEAFESGKGQGWGYIKLLNSGKTGEFDNYEIALPFPAGTSPEKINEGRKVAQILLDEAFRQRRLAKSLQRKAEKATQMKDEALKIAEVPRHLWSEEMEEIYEEYSEGMEEGRHRFHYNDDDERSWTGMDIPF